MKQRAVRRRVSTNTQSTLKEIGSRPNPGTVKLSKDIRSGYGKDQATEKLSSSLSGKVQSKPAKLKRNKRSTKNY